MSKIFEPETAPADGSYRLLLLDRHSSHIHIDFMWYAWQYKILLLFLPAHTSYILQPLDLTGFNLVKSVYRKQIAELSTIDDATPVKKQRFIACYYQARIYGLTTSHIEAGWRATGIYPYQPTVAVNSSQVSNRPVTPPPASPPIQLSDLPFRTPQKPQDIYRAVQALRQEATIPRSTRLVLNKVAKAVAMGNTRAAQLQYENQRLAQLLEQATGPSTKKRAHIDPNERFFNAEAIVAAIEREAAKPEPTPAEVAEKAAKRVADAVQKQTIESMSFE